MSLRSRTLLPAHALLLVASAAPAQQLTEAELLERFPSRSPHFRVLLADVSVVRADAEARTRYPNPTAVYSREGAGLAEFFQVEQPLALSGRRAYLKEAGTSAVAATELTSRRTAWSLRSDLRLAFYQVLAAQEHLKVLESSRSELEEAIGILRRREQEGEGSKYDRLRAQRELVDAQDDLAAARVSVEQARGRIGAFFEDGQSLSGIVAAGAFGPLRTAPTLQELVARALENRPDLAAERMQAERFRSEKLAAERLKIPDPVVSAGLKRADVATRIDNGYVVAVSVPLPLFNRGRAEVARAEAEHDRTEGRLALLRLQIRADVTAAHATFEGRRKAAESYRRETELQNAELRSIAQIAYQEGERTILDLLDVYRLARQGQLRALDLEAAAKSAAIELERAVGEEVFP